MITEFEIADQCAEWSSAKRTIFFFVHLLEQRRLIKFERSFKVLQKVALRHAHDFDLELRTGQRVLDKMMESAPRGFEFLKVLMVHDRVHLGRDQPIDLGDTRVDGNVHILGHREFAAHYLIDEFADHVLGPFLLVLIAGHPALAQNLVEQSAGLFGHYGLGGGILFFSFCHFRLVLLRTKLVAQFLLLIDICDDVLEHGFEFLIAVHLRPQVSKLLPRLD